MTAATADLGCSPCRVGKSDRGDTRARKPLPEQASPLGQGVKPPQLRSSGAITFSACGLSLVA
jgi:hypothetical protein